MCRGVFVLLACLAASEVRAAAEVSEDSFLDAATRDVRVRAVLDEPLRAARAVRARASVLSNPEAGFDREALSGEPRQDTWSVSWTPPLDGRYWAQDRAAREGLRAAENQRELSALALRSELREAFAAWAVAQDGAVLVERLANLVDRLASRTEAQASRGEASVLSALRLSLARTEIRSEAARLTAELARTRGRVRAWMPGLAPEALPVHPPLPPVPTDTSLGATSPRLAVLEHVLLQAEASASVATRFWSLPEFVVGRQTVRGNLVDLDGETYGVRWRVPLFDRQRGERIEARGRVDAARARRELETVRVREGLAAARSAYATLRGSAALAAGAESAASRVLESATAMFGAGESNVTDLLETLRGVLSGQLAALECYAEALSAHRELEVAAGRPLPLIEGEK